MSTTHRRATLVLGVGLVLWGLITHGTHAGTGDDPHYKAIAHSLAFDGDLDLTDEYARETNRIVGGPLEPELHARPGRDGRLRPVHDIGLPLIASPWYRAASWLADLADNSVAPETMARFRLNRALVLRHLLSFFMIALTAWIAVMLLGAFEELGGTARRSAWWAALIVLSPPILSHAYLFFTEILSAALVLWVLLQLRKGDLRPWECWLTGAVTGYLLLVHVRNGGLVLGLTAIAALQWRRRADRRNPLAWFAAGLIPLIALRTLLTWHFWGTWIVTPHARPGGPDAGGAGEVVVRLVGWLVDQEHGLLLTAPIFLLAPAGLIVLWRRNRGLALQLTGLIAVYLATVALPFVNPHGWRGGWSPAARFLVPIVPLLACVVFSLVAEVRRIPALVWGIVALQAAISAWLWQYPKLTWDDGDGESALLAALDGGSGVLSSTVPSLAGPMTPAMWVVIAAGSMLWAAMTLWLVRRVSPGGAGAPLETPRGSTGAAG